MEEYVNENTIIKNETFNSFPEMFICQICKLIMLEPVMCIGCQNYYCKKCIENCKQKSGTCPNGCENPIFKDVIEKNRLIKKMKFKCIKGCGAEILFDDIKNHYSSNCLEKKNENENDENKRKIKILTKKEVAELKKNNKKIDYFTSKSYKYNIRIILYFIVITLGDTMVGKTSLINT